MSAPTGKRTTFRQMTLNNRNVEDLVPGDRPFIAWDDRLTGFGVCVQPAGVRSKIVNYRAGDGGCKSANRRLVIGRHGRMKAEEARRIARKTLGQVADGDDPSAARPKPYRVHPARGFRGLSLGRPPSNAAMSSSVSSG